MPVALIAVVLLLVYAVIAVMIVYHLRTYTINQQLAQRAVIAFLVITALLVCLQIAAFFYVIEGMADDSNPTQPVFGQTNQ